MAHLKVHPELRRRAGRRRRSATPAGCSSSETPRAGSRLGGSGPPLSWPLVIVLTCHVVGVPALEPKGDPVLVVDADAVPAALVTLFDGLSLRSNVVASVNRATSRWDTPRVSCISRSTWFRTPFKSPRRACRSKSSTPDRLTGSAATRTWPDSRGSSLSIPPPRLCPWTSQLRPVSAEFQDAVSCDGVIIASRRSRTTCRALGATAFAPLRKSVGLLPLMQVKKASPT